MDAHFSHESAHQLSSNFEALTLELLYDFSTTHIGHRRVPVVNMRHDRLPLVDLSLCGLRGRIVDFGA